MTPSFQATAIYINFFLKIMWLSAIYAKNSKYIHISIKFSRENLFARNKVKTKIQRQPWRHRYSLRSMKIDFSQYKFAYFTFRHFEGSSIMTRLLVQKTPLARYAEQKTDRTTTTLTTFLTKALDKRVFAHNFWWIL